MTDLRASKATTREAWVDLAKGACILFVVLRHASPYPPFSEDSPRVLIAFNDMMQPFRMPLFFFASGLFAKKALSMSIGTFVKRKVFQLLWVYVVWAVLFYVALQWPRDFLRGRQVDYGQVVYIFTQTVNTYWFVYVLALSYFLTKTLAGIPRFALLLGCAGVTIGFQNSIDAASAVLGKVAYLTPFLVLGSMSLETLRVQLPKRSLLFAVLGFAAVGILWWVESSIPAEVEIAGRAVSFLVSVVGVIALVSFAYWMQDSFLGRCLSCLGKKSIYVYCMHMFFVVAVKSLFVAHDREAAAGLGAILTAFCAGILGPLAAKSLLLRFGFDWLFEIPRFRLLSRKVSTPVGGA
jgi:fucose 4-O-acetylase-like acetyltransferase